MKMFKATLNASLSVVIWTAGDPGFAYPASLYKSVENKSKTLKKYNMDSLYCCPLNLTGFDRS